MDYDRRLPVSDHRARRRIDHHDPRARGGRDRVGDTRNGTSDIWTAARCGAQSAGFVGSARRSCATTPADTYQYVFYDLLTLSPAHPKDTVWVGVSAADAEPYIADEIPTAVPNGGRAGNESSIVACSASARDLTRPTFAMPPPLGDIPEIVTEEPTGREVLAFFDPSTLIPGALPAGSPVAIDRCAADDVLQTVAVVGGHVQVTRADGSTATMDFPNPGDEATVIATLNSAHPEALASRYLLYRLCAPPGIHTLFARVARQSEPFGPYAGSPRP